MQARGHPGMLQAVAVSTELATELVQMALHGALQLPQQRDTEPAVPQAALQVPVRDTAPAPPEGGARIPADADSGPETPERLTAPGGRCLQASSIYLLHIPRKRLNCPHHSNSWEAEELL